MSSSGTVKSFNANKGFGFVQVDGTDVFIHLRECQGGLPQVGDTLMFDLEESRSKPGSYKASNITGGTGAMPEQSAGKGGGSGVKGTGQFFGAVKSFSEMKAWGFVTLEGQDIFFHLKDMVDGSTPKQGDQLQFDLEDNPQKPGSYKAKNVTGGTGWPQAKGKGKDGGKGGWGDASYGAWGGCDPWGMKGWGPYGGCDPWGMKGGWGGKDGGWGGKDGGWGKFGGKGNGGWGGKAAKGGW